jgi:hypothetical protein
MKKISFKGVVIGAIIDIVSSNLLFIPLLVFASVKYNLASVPKAQIATELARHLHGDSVMFGLQVLTGCSCSLLGGYVAARVAKHDGVLNGALSSFLCVSCGIYAMFASTIAIPLWQHLLFLPLSPALAAFGGYLCKPARMSAPVQAP